MIYKNRKFIAILMLIISIQILLNFNNNQKNTFKFFIWNTQEIKLGTLISYSYISGFLIGIFLNYSISQKKIHPSNSDQSINEDDYQSSVNDEDNYQETEIPPQRDLRDTQPTISVNYRVIKNSGERFSQDNNKNLDDEENQDDWSYKEIDW